MSSAKTPTSSLTATQLLAIRLWYRGKDKSTMSSEKTPTSSLTATELLAIRLWYRGKVKINKLLRRGTKETPPPHSSPIAKLPQELLETIIYYLIYDTDALIACSMTCHSWYKLSVPHLHHSLTAYGAPFHLWDKKHEWPKPLQKSYNLGLLPLVKRFRFRMAAYLCHRKFTPQWLDSRTLRYFSALTSLQELGIDNLQIPGFMPDIRQYFGHFAPNLRFLALREPDGSCRQIIYFIGLFPNLQDLKICYPLPREEEEEESMDDSTLVPLFVPPLCGRLTLTCFTREKLMEDMITLFGGLRFRYMDLFRVRCVRLLLDTCAETLETLRFYPTDPYENNQEVYRDFNLSRNRSLRTLETTAEAITVAGDTAADFLNTVLSTITSPLPLDIVISYGDREGDSYVFSWERRIINPQYTSTNRTAANNLRHVGRFKIFRQMNGERGFRLVLCADVHDCITECALRALEHAVESEMEGGRFDCLTQGPLVISEVRSIRTRCSDDAVGSQTKWPIRASAL